MQSNGHYPNGNGAVLKAELPPPNSSEAERAVLGGILIDPDSFYEVSDFLTPHHFYNSTNGAIFKAISDMLRGGMRVDVLTLSETCTARNIQPTSGDLFLYIADLVNAVPTSINTAHYARIIEAAYIRRALYQAGNRIATSALNDTAVSPHQLTEQAERALFDVSDKLSSGKISRISDTMSDLYDKTAAMRERGGSLSGIPTGFSDLDRITRGLNKSDLIILAARPGMGKSAGASDIALSLGRRGYRVGIFNLEMSRESIGQRMIANVAQVNLNQIREGRLSDYEWGKFNEAVGQLSTMNIFIDDNASMTPTQLRAKCRRLYAEHGLDLIIVDYLQLMTGANQQNRVQEISDITRSLKILAKDLDVPILALSQLSRALEARADKRPLLSDLRDSGSIEQDADIVIFLYRDEYYTKEACQTPNNAEWIVAKHRNGPTGTANMYWDGNTLRFRNLASERLNL